MKLRLFGLLPALALCLAAPAFAQTAPADAQTAETQAAITQMYRAYRAETQTLRTRLDAAIIELDALANNTNADPKRIEHLAGEIAAMRSQLGQKRMELREALQKKFGPAAQSAGRPGPRAGQRQNAAPGYDAPRQGYDGYGPRHHHRRFMHGPWCGWMMEGADFAQLPEDDDDL